MSVTHERVHQTFRSLYGRPGLENTNILDIASEVANNDCSVLVDVCADEETNKRRPDGSKINKHPKVCDRQSQWWTDKAIELNLRQKVYGPFKTKYHEFASKCRDSIIHSRRDLFDAIMAWEEGGDAKARVIEKFGQIKDWNVTRVTDMSELFLNMEDFNESIGQWDTSNVTNMRSMFQGARSFNQPIGNWDTSKVTNMAGMF